MIKNRILVVEDDKAISDGIAVNLQYSGYEYKVFGNGQEAADLSYPLNEGFRFGKSYLTLNAIDGSVIDRQLGY